MPELPAGRFAFLPSTWMNQPGQRARELANTPEFTKARRQRKKVEALFAELKNQIGLRPVRLRRLKFVREQFFPAAATSARSCVQNGPGNGACAQSFAIMRKKDRLFFRCC